MYQTCWCKHNDDGVFTRSQIFIIIAIVGLRPQAVGLRPQAVHDSWVIQLISIASGVSANIPSSCDKL